ncbi:hypothetical protein SKAU_G00008260 [Synaphobranchus kaupii]|uniref:Uncharacterized protein n=1 Tax=Synaphobranchus kaupii TaxID=118154 RepID=A0A9Q1GAE2_SYNKA|nr:hypothetical protein SKAU_G00008260 [Synaphobranchus kaupii]
MGMKLQFFQEHGAFTAVLSPGGREDSSTLDIKTVMSHFKPALLFSAHFYRTY